MSSPLEINVELAARTAVLSLAGDLDGRSIGSLVQCIGCLEAGFGTVVLDLGDLDSIDSTAAHALVGLRDEMEVRLQRLRCRNVIGNPARVLELSGVAGTLGIR